MEATGRADRTGREWVDRTLSAHSRGDTARGGDNPGVPDHEVA